MVLQKWLCLCEGSVLSCLQDELSLFWLLHLRARPQLWKSRWASLVSCGVTRNSVFLVVDELLVAPISPRAGSRLAQAELSSLVEDAQEYFQLLRGAGEWTGPAGRPVFGEEGAAVLPGRLRVHLLTVKRRCPVRMRGSAVAAGYLQALVSLA